MKYIKRFEYNSISDPNYVIVNPLGIKSEPTVPKIKELFHDFIDNNIGLIINLSNGYLSKIYSVAYDNVPKKLLPFFMFDYGRGTKKYYISVREEKIIKKSKDKEELEAYINSKKYNL